VSLGSNGLRPTFKIDNRGTGEVKGFAKIGACLYKPVALFVKAWTPTMENISLFLITSPYKLIPEGRNASLQAVLYVRQRNKSSAVADMGDQWPEIDMC